MDLTSLKTKPQVRKFTLDSEEVKALFGDSIDFHIFWPMKIETFVKVSTMSNLDMVKELLVDKDGKKLFDETDENIVVDRFHHLVPLIALTIFNEMGK